MQKKTTKTKSLYHKSFTVKKKKFKITNTKNDSDPLRTYLI